MGGRRSQGQLIFSEKFTDEQGCLYDMNVWKVSASDKYPEGVRYRLAFISRGEDSPGVLYDNHFPKGHHRHVYRREEAYEFQGITKLIEDFRKDIQQAKGDRP